MTKQNTKAAMNDIQNLFDPKGYQDIFKTWAQNNERMTAIATEAGTRSVDIVSDSSKEAIMNMRELSEVREQPTDYGQAYSDFAQKQMDLFMRTMQAMSDVHQKAGSEASEVVTKAGEDMGNKVAANTQAAAEKVNTAAKKAA